MTDGSSGMLRAFLARLLGWTDKRAIDHALRSIDLAVNHDAALVLCGDGDGSPGDCTTVPWAPIGRS